MIAEVLPNAGQLVINRQTQLLEVVGGANARQQQNLGGADGAAAQYDFPALNGEDFAAAFHLHTNRLVAVQTTRRAWMLPRTVRFRRWRAVLKKVSEVLIRTPSMLFIGRGEMAV